MRSRDRVFLLFLGGECRLKELFSLGRDFFPFDFDGDGADEGIAIVDYPVIFFDNGTSYSLYPKKLGVYSPNAYTADLDGDGWVEFLAFQNYRGDNLLVAYKLMPKVRYGLPSGGGPSQIKYNASKYHSYYEIVNILRELASTYPGRVELFHIGKSLDVNGDATINISALKITNGDGVEKPSLLVVGAHHARELITAEAALYLAVNLTEQYGYDPTITAILDNFDVFIVPVLNAGGHDYALLYSDWLRKNLRSVDDDGDGGINEDPPEDTNGDGLINVTWIYSGGSWRYYGYEGYDNDGDGISGEDPPGGVDLNRNYNFSWTSSGQYGDPSSDVYSGPYPLSEPETRALDELMGKTRPIIAMSLHSGEESIFFPWGVGYRIPIEYDIITRTVYIAQVGSGFGAMQSCAIYEAHGVWDDHAYGFYGIIPFTPEIFGNMSWPKEELYEYGGTYYYSYYGIKWRFNPFPKNIRDVCIKVLNMFAMVAQWGIDIISDTTPPTVDFVEVEK